MPQRKISRAHYAAIKDEINYWQQNGLLDSKQASEILGLYEIKQGISFLRVILVTGAVLVGLGILSFIASNWQEISKLFRFMIIVIAFLAANLAAFFLEEGHPKTSRSLIYLGALIYGAGIFLIGQIFNFSGHFTGAFILWAAGIFPAAVLFRDKILYLFSMLLLLVYLNGSFPLAEEPWFALLAIPLLYWCNRYLDSSQIILYFNNLAALNTIGFFAFRYELDGLLIAVLFLGIGLWMMYFPVYGRKPVFQIQGSLIVGIAGLFLTYPWVWKTWQWVENQGIGGPVSIAFTIGFLIFLLLLTRKENLIALIFICVTIFRYYFDLTYDFLPKSVFFLISGMLLLGFGFFIERRIKRKGGSSDAE